MTKWQAACDSWWHRRETRNYMFKHSFQENICVSLWYVFKLYLMNGKHIKCYEDAVMVFTSVGSFHQKVMSSSSEFVWQNTFCSKMKINSQTRSQFCTFHEHDSWAGARVLLSRSREYIVKQNTFSKHFNHKLIHSLQNGSMGISSNIYIMMDL